MEAKELFGLLLQHAVRMEDALLLNDPESLLAAKLNGKVKGLRPAVKELEQKGLLAVYRKRGGKIEHVVLVREDYPIEVVQPQPEPEQAVPQADVQAIQPSQQSENGGAPEQKATKVAKRQIQPERKKGEIRKIREAAEKGDRSEDFLFKTASELLDGFRGLFPATFQHVNCSRSGRHRPSNGQIDLKDHAGNDVSPELSVCLASGQLVTGYVILDAKSSQSAVKKFNADIRVFPGQKNARAKQAICSNPSRRTKADLASELMELLVRVGLCPLEQPQRETVIDWISRR